MKCLFKENTECSKKSLKYLGLFSLAVLILSLTIKIVTLIISILGGNDSLNLATVVISTILIMIVAGIHCCKYEYNNSRHRCCHKGIKDYCKSKANKKCKKDCECCHNAEKKCEKEELLSEDTSDE